MLRAIDHKFLSSRLSRRHFLATLVGALAIGLGSLAPHVSNAQSAPAVTLVGRAVLPASQLADGPASANELAKTGKSINGIDLPLMSQPLGNVVGIWPGQDGSWVLLTGTAFDNRQLSGDVLLRLYTVQVDWKTASGGGGQVTPVDWVTLNDYLNKYTTALQNPGDTQRQLTGADFSPRGFATTDKSKSWWIADSQLPSILHVNAKGSLINAQRPIQANAGKVQGISVSPSGKTLLVITQTDAQTDTIQAQDLTSGQPIGSPLPYKLANAGDETRGWVMINEQQALVLESDTKQGTEAAIKRVYLADFGNGTVTKTLLADLLHISDPGHLGTDPAFGDPSGQVGLNPFTYPYADLAGIYLTAPDTVVIVNNNHVPFNTGRKAKTAENTELIEVKLAAPLGNVTLSLPGA